MTITITVDVCYAAGVKTAQQALIPVTLPTGSTVEAAINASGILAQFPEMILETMTIGLFSRRVKLSDTLAHYDRVEIYRPLTIDPKQARRLRAR